MKETWRWYGPLDQIRLSEVRQTGAAGIVTALHEIPYGEVWQRTTIAKRRDKIRVAGFEWDVVESLPLHEDIKRGTGDLTSLFAEPQSTTRPKIILIISYFIIYLPFARVEHYETGLI